MPSLHHGILFILLSSFLHHSHCNARTFTLEMHHGFSEPVKKWVHPLYPNWPAKGTVDYYAALADRDRLRLARGRRLAEYVNGSVTFSDGDSTLRINSMGFLHYATVSLGTPGKKFLVALDTGSDLFWVPCNCGSCAPTSPSSYGSDYGMQLNIYDPNGSSTSKKITCNNSLCAQRNLCLGTFSNCPYVVSYVSTDTSTSGVLVEDVLHLITEDDEPEVIGAQITFGCGQVQTGSFLDFAAPNGLFGLGMEKLSVPSMLSRVGLMANSFSMCFGPEGFGRISFGDKGSPDQDQTPFIFNLMHPTYNISITQIRVGSSLIDFNISALFDSGTSFTYLMDPAYTQISRSFNIHTRDIRLPPDPRIPFQYCYKMSSDANSSVIPTMGLIMKGGSLFSVYDPIIVISHWDELVYCLAILKHTDMNIIGQNFMTGYKVVFDREKLVLGWKKFDCYNHENSDTQRTNLGNSSVVSPALDAESGGYTQSATKDSWNNQRIPVKGAVEVNSSLQWNDSSRHFVSRTFLSREQLVQQATFSESASVPLFGISQRLPLV